MSSSRWATSLGIEHRTQLQWFGKSRLTTYTLPKAPCATSHMNSPTSWFSPPRPRPPPLMPPPLPPKSALRVAKDTLMGFPLKSFPGKTSKAFSFITCRNDDFWHHHFINPVLFKGLWHKFHKAKARKVKMLSEIGWTKYAEIVVLNLIVQLRKDDHKKRRNNDPHYLLYLWGTHKNQATIPHLDPYLSAYMASNTTTQGLSILTTGRLPAYNRALCWYFRSVQKIYQKCYIVTDSITCPIVFTFTSRITDIYHQTSRLQPWLRGDHQKTR